MSAENWWVRVPLCSHLGPLQEKKNAEIHLFIGFESTKNKEKYHCLSPALVLYNTKTILSSKTMYFLIMKYESFNHIFSNLLHTPYDFPRVLHFLSRPLVIFHGRQIPKWVWNHWQGWPFLWKFPVCKAYVIVCFQCVFMWPHMTI